jgi:hypothetical protein
MSRNSPWGAHEAAQIQIGPEKLNPTPERSVAMERLSVALWTTNLEPQVASLAVWWPASRRAWPKAQAAGALLLMSPAFAAWLASIAGPALEGLQPLPVRYGVTCSAPCRLHIGRGAGTAGHLNRAWLLLPHGRTFATISASRPARSASRPASRTQKAGSSRLAPRSTSRLGGPAVSISSSPPCGARLASSTSTSWSCRPRRT